MAYILLPGDRDQEYLIPPSMWEWLGEGDPAWFKVGAVEQVELGEFYRQYRADGWGAAASDPKMMVGVVLYAFQVIRSTNISRIKDVPQPVA